MNELKDVTKDQHPVRYQQLLQQITANFDSFEDDGKCLWGSNKTASRKDKDNQFIGYTFKRKKDLARTALSEDLFGFNSNVPVSPNQVDASLASPPDSSSSLNINLL